MADDYDQLWAGNVPGLFVPVSVTPTGVVLSAGPWTGTVLGGTGPDGQELGTANPFSGLTTSTSATWIGAALPSGTSLHPVYGISGVLAVPCNDGTVDLADYADFEPCLAGPGVVPGAGCPCFDLDGDGIVTLRDFGMFQVDFGG